MRASIRSWARFGAPTAVAAAGLSLAWWGFYHWRPPTFVLTSFRLMRPLAPFYGFFLPRASGGAWAAAAVLIAGLAGAALMRHRRAWLFLAYALLFAAALRFSVRAARVPELPGSEFTTYLDEEVIYDAIHIISPLDFLRDYSTLQDKLSLHGRTKPPGFALLHYALHLGVGDTLTATGSALTLLASLIVLPGYALGRLLRGRDQDGRACALLLACLPGSVLFGAVSLDAVFAVVAATTFAFALLEARRPRIWTRLSLGLSLALGMMLSYSTFVVGLFCFILLACEGWRKPLRIAIGLAQVLAAFVLPLLLLRLYPGFSAWDCFLNARRLNAVLMAGMIGQDPSAGTVWLYASIGNLLAFLLSLGPPVVGCLIRSRGEPGAASLPRSVTAAFSLTLLAACLGGLYLMETERTLLFLAAPALLLVILNPDFKPIPAAALCGTQAIAMELLIYTLY